MLRINTQYYTIIKLLSSNETDVYTCKKYTHPQI
jgi:hypothetical protein